MTSAGKTTEELLAAWREAIHVLDELESDTRGRAEADARLEEARAAYQARLSGVDLARQEETVTA
jgi:hypothetical protein